MAITLALLVVYSGFCGGGQQSSSGGVKKMTYTFWGSDMERNAQNGAIDAFNKSHPGISVEPMHIPSAGNEYTIRVTAMVNSGNAPDVGYLAAGLSFVWAREGRLYDIMDFMRADPEYSMNTYVDNIYYYFSEGKSHGHTSSINSMGIFYNKDCFDAAGVRYPPSTPQTAWTWEQFVDVAQTLTLDMNGRNAKDPNFNKNQIRQYGALVQHTYAPQLLQFLDSNGADLLTPDGRSLALDTPEARDALQKMADLIHKYYVSPIPTESNLTEIGDPPQALRAKRAAMAFTGYWNLLDMPRMGINWDVGVIPKMKDYRQVIFAGIMCIFKDSKHPQEAWTLYKYLQNPTGALTLYRDGLWMPVLRDWYEKPDLFSQWATGPAHPANFKPVFVDHLFQKLSTPDWTLRIMNFNDIWAAVNAGLQPLWLGTASVNDVVTTVTRTVNPIVQGYNPSTGHASKYR